MRNILTSSLVAIALGPVACDRYRGPSMTLPAGRTDKSTPAPVVPVVPAQPTAAAKKTCDGPYCGLTLSEWGKQLNSADRDEVMEACRALRVLGPDGRPLLFEGLENPRSETRRLCLESLSLADFKRAGEAGRQRLVKLAGDRDDVRIRERASSYLMQWHSSVLAP